MVRALVHTGTTLLYTRIVPVTERQHKCSSRKKKLLFLFVVVGYGLHEHNVRTDILCDLLDLEFPEMGCLNLELSAGDSNDTILGGLDTLADFLAFTHIDFHGFFTSIPHITRSL